MSTMLDVIMYTIISNVLNLGLRFTKLIDKITKSKQDKT